MDNDFDNVTWQREDDAPSTPSQHAENQYASSRLGVNGKRRTSSTQQAGPQADAVDLGGIGSGVLECTVDAPLKEGDGSKDAYVSYLVTTQVRICLSFLPSTLSFPS